MATFPAPPTRTPYNDSQATGYFVRGWIQWYQAITNALNTSQFADGETPAGQVGGGGKVFTLTNAPQPAASLMLFLNGVLQLQGPDYALNSQTITYTAAIPAGGVQVAWYRY